MRVGGQAGSGYLVCRKYTENMCTIPRRHQIRVFHHVYLPLVGRIGDQAVCLLRSGLQRTLREQARVPRHGPLNCSDHQ